MTLMAESALSCNLRVYNFELMSNHLHLIVSADKQQCMDFLAYYRKRLIRYAHENERTLNLSSFVCEPLKIDTLDSLRNNISYVSRNGFVVNSAYTPYSYPWGAGHLYFLPDSYPLGAVLYNSLSRDRKRLLTHSRTLLLPDSYTVRDGYITPESFVDYHTGMSFFRDAHHYFYSITKKFESYAEFSSRFSDMVTLTDEEMYAAAASLSRNRYNMDKPLTLNNSDKIQLAKTLHFEYNASNSQIQRILKLGKETVSGLFPEAR